MLIETRVQREHRADHASGVVEDLQRPGAELGSGGRDRLEVQRYVEVLVK